MFWGKGEQPPRAGPRQQLEGAAGQLLLLLHQTVHHGGSASPAP